MKLEVEVFRAGEHTDMSGNTKVWTEEDLDKIVEMYNNQSSENRHEAPVVIGHPVTDSPAYGWVEKLERRGSVLYATLKDLTKEFVEWVKKGLYKKRSIALYDNLLLKHIGFLGAVPPAVKGLADPVFQSEKKVTYEYEFAEETKSQEFSDIRKENEKDLTLFSRSERFRIKIHDEIRREKPVIYKHLSDEEFADPVHYRFPLSREYIIASLASWSRPASRKYYSEEDVKMIASRLLRAALRHRINLTLSKWAYSQFVDMPLEKLTRQQLLDYIKEKENVSQHFEEVQMTEEQFNQFKVELLAWLSETFGEEVASQTSAYIEEIQPKFLQKPMEVSSQQSQQQEDKESAEGNYSELKRENMELRQRIVRLETENRLKDFKAYTERLIKKGQLLPAQEDVAISLLELGHSFGVTKFAEQGKMQDILGVDLVKKLLESYPEHQLYSEQVKATGNTSANEFEGLPVAPDALDLYTKVINYQEEMRKNGKEIGFKEALRLITKGGK